MKLLRRVLFAAFVFSLVSTAALWADDDPPGRVARLQYLSGSVSVQPRGADGWVAGSLNRPLTTSDNIWADKDSRAEFNIGGALMRINDESSITLTNISDNAVQVQLHQGTLNLRIRHLYGGEIYEVDTPNIAFTVQKSGDYRFDVEPNGDATLVTVRKGEGDATGDGPSVRVHSHERARFTNGNSLAHEISEAPPFDGFDDWCRVRDRRLDHSYSARYVSPGVIGYEDLDEYGSWRTVPTYGAVWVPASLAVGWAPYRYGHWVWINPWGWTWVDDAAWGFAPFHYGRWVYVGYWAWVPGPVYVRPVYAPALVTWFGGGFGVGVSFGYGWCPLGFGEPYIPWYGGSRRYFQNVNVTNTRITNITYITNNYYNNGGRNPRHVQPLVYANLKAPGAVTAVDHKVIVDSMPVARNAVAVTPRDSRDVAKTAMLGKVDLEPTRESRLGADRDKVAAQAPAVTRPVVTRMSPPAAAARAEHPAAQPGNKPLLASPARASDDGPALRPTVATPATAHVVPQPSTKAVDNAPASATRRVPRPPAAITEARETAPAPLRVVPRPPDATRAPDAPATPAPGTRVAAPRHETAPASPRESTTSGIRAVPRPPAGEVMGSHASAPEAHASGSQGGVPPAGPANNDSPRSESPRAPVRVMPDVPRPSGPVAPASPSMGPDEHRSRGPAPSGSAPVVREGASAPQSSAPPHMSAPAPQSAPHVSAPSSAPSAPHGGGAQPSHSAPAAGAQPAPHTR